MFQATALGRSDILKGVKTGLQATFSKVCLAKMNLKSNDTHILVKTITDKRIKTNEDQ